MSTLSCSRWIFLLSLAALMLISASEGSRFQALPCWEDCSFLGKQNIQTCYEQTKRHDCDTHGYVVTNKKGNTICINGHTRWIKKMIARGHLHCPPDISQPL